MATLIGRLLCRLGLHRLVPGATFYHPDGPVGQARDCRRCGAHFVPVPLGGDDWVRIW